MINKKLSKNSNLVVVESPSKIKSIQKFLGSDYIVIASKGHIRELEKKDGSIDVNNNFEARWQNNEKVPGFLKQVPKNIDIVYLATDPDREGEAISWHVKTIISKKNKSVKFKRVRFNAITKAEVQKAFNSPQELNIELVEAYMARLAIDYLVGFNISPVLWSKVPGCKSAGRVQSVALRLITEREKEIFKFEKEEYWTISGLFSNDTFKVECDLVAIESKKLSKMDIKNNKQSDEIVKRLKSENYHIESIESKTQKTKPNPPFHTVSMQQYAFNNLSMGATKTMKVAQELYEGIDLEDGKSGLITYMRTDSISMSPEGIKKVREYIADNLEKKYLNSSTRVYKSKAKNSQEAHEAIIPTDFSRTPQSIKSHLSKNQYDLYNAIWKRAVSSQMSDAVYDARNINIESTSQDIFKGREKKLIFDGHLYFDQKEMNHNGFVDIKSGSSVNYESIESKQNFTSPPARYNEGSLIKKLEELGIGRPSTYARIIQVIQDREYIYIDQKKIYPETTGMILVSFLTKYFDKYVDYNFTASLENNLDEISAANINFLKVMSDFWTEFKKFIDQEKLSKGADSNLEIIEHISEDLVCFLNKDLDLKCPTCLTGKVILKSAKRGLKRNWFWGCKNYNTTKCLYTKNFSILGAEDQTETKIENNDETLFEKGSDKIQLKKGPYGYYIKTLQSSSYKNISFKSIGLKDKDQLSEVDSNHLVKLLELPLVIGSFEGEDVSLSNGKYNPVLNYKGQVYRALKSIFEIDLEYACEVIKKGALEPPESSKKRNFRKSK